MEDLYGLQHAHVAAALISGAGFVVRGVWMLAASPLLQARAVRILPHVVDTLLLLSGVGLALGLSLSPLQQPWLATKLVLVVLYIALGMVALRRGRTRRRRAVALALALGCYGLILASALTHRPLGLF